MHRLFEMVVMVLLVVVTLGTTGCVTTPEVAFPFPQGEDVVLEKKDARHFENTVWAGEYRNFSGTTTNATTIKFGKVPIEALILDGQVLAKFVFHHPGRQDPDTQKDYREWPRGGGFGYCFIVNNKLRCQGEQVSNSLIKADDGCLVLVIETFTDIGQNRVRGKWRLCEAEKVANFFGDKSDSQIAEQPKQPTALPQ